MPFSKFSKTPKLKKTFTIVNFNSYIIYKVKYMKNIMIVFGGKSVEHDISIITGVQITHACKGLGYQIFPIYIDKENRWHLASDETSIKDYATNNIDKLKPIRWIVGDTSLYYESKFHRLKKIAKIDFAILCNHGISGEDGSLPSLMELSNIPYSSSNLASCALAMDKCFMKDIFKANHIDNLPYIKVNRCEYEQDKNSIIDKITNELGESTIIKPANLGSSIGISTAKDLAQLEKAIDFGFQFDNKLLIEKRLNDFIEVNVSVCRDKNSNIVASICEYPTIKADLLTFEDKYMQKENNKNKLSKDYEIKHLLPLGIESQAQNIAKNIYAIFDASGIVRIDFLYDNVENILYANEINTIPGSLAINLWLKSGVSYASTIKNLIANGIKKHEEKNALILDFQSSVLQK